MQQIMIIFIYLLIEHVSLAPNNEFQCWTTRGLQACKLCKALNWTVWWSGYNNVRVAWTGGQAQCDVLEPLVTCKRVDLQCLSIISALNWLSSPKIQGTTQPLELIKAFQNNASHSTRSPTALMSQKWLSALWRTCLVCW